MEIKQGHSNRVPLSLFSRSLYGEKRRGDRYYGIDQVEFPFCWELNKNFYY
jgi:hypothetical protein